MAGYNSTGRITFPTFYEEHPTSEMLEKLYPVCCSLQRLSCQHRARQFRPNGTGQSLDMVPDILKIIRVDTITIHYDKTIKRKLSSYKFLFSVNKILLTLKIT